MVSGTSPAPFLCPRSRLLHANTLQSCLQAALHVISVTATPCRKGKGCTFSWRGSIQTWSDFASRGRHGASSTQPWPRQSHARGSEVPSSNKPASNGHVHVALAHLASSCQTACNCLTDRNACSDKALSCMTWSSAFESNSLAAEVHLATGFCQHWPTPLSMEKLLPARDNEESACNKH